YLFIFSVLACIAMHRYLTGTEMIHVSAALSSLILGMTFARWYLEKNDYREQLADQSKAADLLITESNARYNDARLIQDLGQAISRTLDTDTILETVTHTLRERLDYDRGIILLADDEKTRLVYKAGYGLTDEQVRFLQENALRLDNPDRKGPFVASYQERKPFLIDDPALLSRDLSDQSVEILQLSRSGSFICVPIVYEDEALGILIVDRKNSVPLLQNDLNLLLGVAPQIAISISNARTFEKLQEEEQHYRDLVESSGSIIIRLDQEGRIKFANRYALQFYGYNLDEVLHRDLREFIVSASHTGGTNLAPYIDRFLKSPESFTTGKTEILRKSGERAFVYWSTKGIRNRQGDLVEILCVGNDITEWVKAEEEKSELEESLIKSQKMEAIGTLAGGVAHDLNNILSGLTSYPDLLLIDMPEDAPYRKALMTIKRSGERAAAIVQDLLTLARRGVSISNPVDLNQIIQDYFESPEYLKMHSFHTDVNFITRLDPDIKPILGSETHLMKTIMNLVNNAAEALPDKGTVTVSTSSVYMDRTIKGDGKVPAGEYVMLTVSDNGIGIPEEDQQKIFEPFYTKKKMGKSGTGLGMTVVWSTVKDHKGYIEIESEEGTGTTFNIYFPVTRKKLKEIGIDRIDMYQGSERVMVVDDEEYQRDLTMEVLSRLGYQVDAASSGEEALEKMQSRPADLLILDMMMDGIDGLDTYKGALELQRKQKALIVSGYSETDRVKEALRLGAGGYIKKPYALQDFARAVRRELDKKVH
ncbi:MAG TPA: ATP-binding protein, partial [Deltaproteobacteria bacterium]|nr:ATP-binding protein [Deltaproteobacteria bacterium]